MSVTSFACSNTSQEAVSLAEKALKISEIIITIAILTPALATARA